MLGFLTEIDQLGHTALHAEGHFILGDTGVDFGISEVAVSVGVETSDHIDKLPLTVERDSIRTGEIEDRIAF